MIYFFNNDLELEKVVKSSNVLMGNHEHELNNLIRADVVLDLEHALSFIDDVDFFGYYYKDVFYLHKITREESEHEAEVMVIAGRHIFFEDMLYSEVIKDIRPQNRDAKYMLDQAIGGHTRWNVVMTDVTGTLSTNFYWQMPYEALEWIVEHFRLEYLPVILFDGQKINGYELHVKKRLGENKGIRIPWGERVEKLNYEVDYSDIVTQLAPRGKGEEIGEDVYGRRINISDVSFSRNGVVSPIGNLYLEDKNLTAKYGNDGGKPRKGEGQFYDIDDVNELAEAGYQMYLDVSRPQVVISADVVDIGDVTIGDGVNIIRREHDLYFEARVHKISVDLLNPDDAQIELGDYEHFKESKVQKSNKKRIDTIEREFQGIIHQLKIEFDENFDGVVNQWNEEFEQALIDAYAEIQVAEERMERLISTTRNEWTETFEDEVAEIYRKADEDYNRIETEITGVIDSTRSEMESEFESKVSDAREYADNEIAKKEQQYVEDWNQRDAEIQQTIEKVVGGSIESLDTNLLDVNSRLLSKLDESDLQPLHGRIDDAFSDISEVSGNLNTTRSELQGQLDDAFSDISDVSGELSSARSELQEQLDKARAELEGLEVGGENIVSYRDYSMNNDYQIVTKIDDVFHKTEEPIYHGVKTSTASPLISFKTIDVYPDEDISASVYIKHSIDNTERHTTDIIFYDLDNRRSLKQAEVSQIKEEWYRLGTTYKNDTENIQRIAVYFYLSRNTDNVTWFTSPQVEYGNVITEHKEPLEKRHEKITTLSESIEYIDGQLEAKLNRTEIEPIQNKITEYGTTLDANVESIGLLQEKTELHDDDIEQWSNQATSTAEEVSRILTHNSEQDGLITSVINESRETAEGLERVISRVSETESGISTAKADIIANADLIGATMSRVDENDQAIGDFQATADGLRADFTRYQSDFGDDMSAIQAQVASYEANVDGFRAEVGVLSNDVSSVESWQNEKGIIIDGNADAIRTRIWQTDIDAIQVGGRNFALNSKRELTNAVIAEWGFADVINFVPIDGVTLKHGDTVTFSVYVDDIPDGESVYARLDWYDNENIYATNANRDLIVSDSGRIYVTATIPDNSRWTHIRARIMPNNWTKYYNINYMNEQLEKGNKATDWSPAPEDIQSEFEKSIADINLSVDGITADFANYKKNIDSDIGALSSQVASYEVSVDGFRAEVGTLSSNVDDLELWRADKGSLFEQTADKVQQSVWMDDLENVGANLIPMSSGSWENGAYWSGNGQNNPTNSRLRLKRTQSIPLIKGEEYTFTDESIYNSLITEIHFYQFEAGEYLGAENWFWVDRRGSITFTAAGDELLLAFSVLDGFNMPAHFMEIDGRVVMKLERGSTATPILSVLEQLEKRTDFIIQSDGFFLGGKYVGGEHYSTAIVGDADGLKLLGDTIIESNLTVRGIIEGHSLNAVEAEVGRVVADHIEALTIDVNDVEGITAAFQRMYTLNANIERLVSQHVFVDGVNALVGNFVDVNAGNIVTSGLSADVIKASHLDVDTTMVRKFFATTARIDQLITRNHYVDNVKTLSIDAVYADLRRVNSEIMTSNIIKADWLQSGTALFDKVFINNAMVQRLTSKSAFIRDIQSIEITANQLNLNTLTNRINQIEGGLRIKRPDGVDWVRNGMSRGHVPIQTFDFYGSQVDFSGFDFYTDSSSWQRFRVFDTPHEGTKLRIVWGVGFSGPSSSEYVEVRVTTYGNYKPINMGSGTSTRRQFVSSGTTFITQEVPMPPPTYRHMQCYLEFRRAPDGTNSRNRVRARVNFIGQYD